MCHNVCLSAIMMMQKDKCFCNKIMHIHLPQVIVGIWMFHPAFVVCVCVGVYLSLCLALSVFLFEFAFVKNTKRKYFHSSTFLMWSSRWGHNGFMEISSRVSVETFFQIQSILWVAGWWNSMLHFLPQPHKRMFYDMWPIKLHKEYIIVIILMA